VPYYPLRRLAAHPFDEFLHLRVLPQRLEGGKVSGRLFFGKKGMQFAMADAVQIVSFPATPGLWLPMVPSTLSPSNIWRSHRGQGPRAAGLSSDFILGSHLLLAHWHAVNKAEDV